MQVRVRDRALPGGFTLIELLVVMLIILLVSAATLPTVISAYSHREVGDAARILQAALAGARDQAINTNRPAGIRLLPDPSYPGINPTTGAHDPRFILASNRFVPIQLAPNYSEGRVRLLNFSAFAPTPNTLFKYPSSKSPSGVTTYYPAGTDRMMYLGEQVFNSAGGINSPTSWYWNVRIGDRVQLDNGGPWYTIVGPMNVENPEGFVNIGPPGTVSPLTESNGSITRPSEFLFLVNGMDDNRDGYVDNGWDGIDNNGDGVIDRAPDVAAGIYYEWLESESWPSSQVHTVQIPYSIARRPIVAPGARETVLPRNVVIDLTFADGFAGERSRLPVDTTTGHVDVLLDPSGRVVPATEYSSPTSFGMDSSFYHFWIAERSDLYPINVNANGTTAPLFSDTSTNPDTFFLLPMPYGASVAGVPNGYDQIVTRNPTIPVLKGEIRLITLYTRTGNIITSEAPSFDVTNVNQPYTQPQRGVRGGQ